MTGKTSIFRFFVRSSEAGHLLENFLLSSVSSILVIRFFLEITNYPKIGGDGLHIAHMLWGGLLMLLALVILLVYLNKEAKSISAIVGGIGFGVFIDEIGKFVTSDNNYFYEPAIALIYAIFILLFLVFRSFERKKKLNSREYIINAIEATKDVVAHDLDEKERKTALKFLKKADSQEPIVKMLEELFEKIGTLPEEKPSFITKLQKYSHKRYESLISNSWFIKTIIGFFIISSTFAFLRVFVVIPSGSPETFSEWAFIFSSGISGLLVLIGVYFLSRNSRLTAFQMFKRAVLVSIFLTQFFIFVEDQLSALLGLGFSLLILVTVQYLITEERLLEKEN